MTMNNDRICVKCNKVLHDKEVFCSNCGMLSGKIQKGTIFIKAKNVIPLGFCLLLIGIGLITIFIILLIKGITLSSMVVGALFGLGLVPIIIGYTLIKKWREFVNVRKAEIKNDISSIYCKHCYTGLDEESNYCNFCGSKIL